MSYAEIADEIGDLDEFSKQIGNCEQSELIIVGPVYKSWNPQLKINKKVRESEYLKNISTIEILQNIIVFLKQHRIVSVRQIYYGLVSLQLINNNLNEYRRIVRIVKRGRLAGIIDFNKVVDDTRGAEKTSSWSSIEEILGAAVDQYRSDWWIDQENYIEVWLEKRALRRIFLPITDAVDVSLCIGGGYQSWSEVWEAKERYRLRKEQQIIILYFGDLDPSGKDMPRDIKSRFDTLGINVEIKEIALTKDDIEQYDLPKNPTKKKDTRKKGYIEKYGITWSVELDALPPEILQDRIRKAILEHVDFDLLLEKKRMDEASKSSWYQIINSIITGDSSERL